jgi:hypothetical protein
MGGRPAGPTDPNLHFVAEDVTTLPAPKFRGHLLLAALLRKQVFVDELEQPEHLYELSETDLQWRHIFAQSA